MTLLADIAARTVPRLNDLFYGTDSGGATDYSFTLSQLRMGAISVKDYGAVGNWDGTSGADDTAAIQAAIDAAEAHAKIGRPPIVFPAGAYKITSPGLTILENGMRLIGLGGRSFSEGLTGLTGSTLITPDSSFTLMSVGGSFQQHQGTVIEHLNFRSSSGDNTTTLLKIVEFQRGLVRECTFNGGVEGILMTAVTESSRWLIDHCFFRQCDFGVKCLDNTAGGVNNTITNCDFEMSSGALGILLGDKVFATMIMGNLFDSGVGGKGIEINGGHHSIVANKFERVNAGILIDPGASAGAGLRNSLIGNSFIGAGGGDIGIDLRSGAENNMMIGNGFQVYSTFVSDAGDNNIRIDHDANIFAGATVDMPDLPTSDPSVVGRLWSNSGVLTVSAG